jgi:hypothetical protein
MELVFAALLLAAGIDDAPKAPKSDVCHAPPGNPANARTADHLAHGDTAGACATEGAAAGKVDTAGKADTAAKADTKAGGGKSKSPVCHVGDGESARTLYLPAPAVRAHLRHGDAAGPCAGADAGGDGAR